MRVTLDLDAQSTREMFARALRDRRLQSNRYEARSIPTAIFVQQDEWDTADQIIESLRQATTRGAA